MKIKFTSYSIDEPIKNCCKSYGLWLHIGNRIYPGLYFQKPKWMNQEDFLKLIDKICLMDLNINFKVEKR